MAALAAILLPPLLTAQIAFERTYGGADADCGWSVDQTADGGYVIAGETESYGAGEFDIYLIRTDCYGDTLWMRTYGGATGDGGFAVQATADGGCVVAGTTEDYPGYKHACIIRTDADGDTLWTRAFRSEYSAGSGVRQTFGGGYIIAGYNNPYGEFENVWLTMTDDEGESLWTRTYGGSSSDLGWSVQQTTDSGFIVAGQTCSFGALDWDVYLIRTNTRGDTLWTRTFGGTSDDFGYSARQTADGGFVVVGSTQSFGAGGTDVYLIKTDADGDTLWTKTFGGGGYEDGGAVEQTADSAYIVVGSTQSSGAGYSDVWLLKISADGDTAWTRTFGGDSGESGWSGRQTADGGFVAAGVTRSFGAGSGDVYLIKTDSLGNVAVAEPKASPTREPAFWLSCEPNPARVRTTVRLSPFALRHSPLTLRVFDSQGRLVMSQPVRTSSFPLSTSDLPSGTYFLVLTAGGQHARARIVLQR